MTTFELNTRPTVAQLCSLLHLMPHPEGGFYTETYRSDRILADEVCSSSSSSSSSSRNLSTCIYFLLTSDTFSELHRLASDEIFHFYLGDTVELLCLKPDGSSELIKLGTNLLAGEVVQYVVKAGVMFGARVKAGGQYALLGTTVAPGFDFADFEQGQREALVAAYPERKEMIEALTRLAGV